MEEEYLIVIEKDYDKELQKMRLENEKLNKQKMELENKLFEKINDNYKIISKYEKKIIDLNSKFFNSNKNIIRTQPLEISNTNIISSNIIELEGKYFYKNIFDRIEYNIISIIYSIFNCACLRKIKN